MEIKSLGINTFQRRAKIQYRIKCKCVCVHNELKRIYRVSCTNISKSLVQGYESSGEMGHSVNSAGEYLRNMDYYNLDILFKVLMEIAIELYVTIGK